MRLWLALAVVGAASTGCAAAGKGAISPIPAKALAPDTTHVMAVFGRFATAHACPVSADLVLTNAHVVDPAPDSDVVPLQWQRWSDDAGNSGWLKPIGTLQGSDLAGMRPSEPLKTWYERAEESPREGDRLWLVQYSWNSEDEAYKSDVLAVKVVRVVAGSVIYKPGVKPGSSGSCVLDANGHLVAINAWAKAVGSMGEKEVGIGVGVWGSWISTDVFEGAAQ